MENDVMDGVEEQLLGPGAGEELEGLGRAAKAPFSPQQVRVAKAFAARKATQAVKSSVMTRSQKIFGSRLNELPEEEQKQIRSGQLQFADGDFYVRSEVTGTGTQTLLDPSSTLKKGKTNINKGELPPGTNLLVSKIRVGYATHATQTDSAALVYGSEGVNLQAAFANAEFRILVNDRPAYTGRLSKFFSDGQNGLVPHAIEAHSEHLNLEAPFLIPAGAQIKIEIETPAGIAISGTDKHHFEVALMGPVTKKRV